MSKNNDENIHAEHRKRIRAKFAGSGFSEFHPHEVLEQVLFSVLPRINTNPIGHRLVKKFGKIGNVLRAPKSELEKVDGIGPKSAEYLSQFVPQTTEMILRQYREVSNLNIYEIAFLADWFMRSIENDELGVIVCDSDMYFMDFKCVKYSSDFSDQIIELAGGGFYYLLMKQTVLEVADIYRLLDATSKRGASMVNAYRLEGRQPVSLIFSK